MIETKQTMTLFGESVEVEFPNIEQYIQIEEGKTWLTNGKYSLMSLNMSPSGVKALDMVDALVYGSVLCKSQFLRKWSSVNLKVLVSKPIGEDMEELMRWYREEYAPFHNAIEKRTDRVIASPAIKEVKADGSDEG